MSPAGERGWNWRDSPKELQCARLIEKDKPLREAREEKPDRLSDKTCGVFEVKRKEGFKWGEWSAMLNPTERTMD